MVNKIVLILCTVTLTACGALKNMDEMKKTTGEMAVVTKKMESSMSDSMMSLRTAVGFNINKEAFESLLTAKTMDQKIVYARVYLNSFEFQGWTGANFDTTEGRDELFRQGINKFYADITEVIGNIDDITELPLSSKPTEDDYENRINSIMAIAMSLHEVNAHQKDFAHARGFQPKHMLNLIEEGINAYAAEKSGKGPNAMPEYVKATLINIGLAKTILQVRYNGLTIKLVSMISDIQSKPTAMMMLAAPWQVDYSKLDNSATAERAVKISQLLIQTKQILSKVNVSIPNLRVTSSKKILMPGFSKILENMAPNSAIANYLPYKHLAEELKKNLSVIKSFYK